MIYESNLDKGNVNLLRKPIQEFEGFQNLLTLEFFTVSNAEVAYGGEGGV